jgi:hypothetical protein
MPNMKTLTINGVAFNVIDDDAVRFNELQELTPDQKAQARANIGAVTVEDVLTALPTWQGGSY